MKVFLFAAAPPYNSKFICMRGKNITQKSNIKGTASNACSCSAPPTANVLSRLRVYLFPAEMREMPGCSWNCEKCLIPPRIVRNAWFRPDSCLGQEPAAAPASDAQTQHEQTALPSAHTQYPDLNMTTSHFFSIRTLQNTTSLNPTNISTKTKPQNIPASLESAVTDKWSASVCFPAMLQQAAVMQPSPLTNMLPVAAHSQKAGFWQSSNHLLQKCSSCSLFLSTFCLTEEMNKDLFQPQYSHCCGHIQASASAPQMDFSVFHLINIQNK